MWRYIVKRLLIMVPTFLFITVIVFVMINIAPGEPGQSAGASGSEAADQSASSREGYRLFKEQYHLDLPIAVNLRFLLKRGRVADTLEVIARNMTSPVPGENAALSVGDTAASVIGRIANEDYVALQTELTDPSVSDEDRREGRARLQAMDFVQLDPIRPERPAQGDVFNAEERIENWGQIIVPFLMELAQGYVYIVPQDAENGWRDGRGVLMRDVEGLGETLSSRQTLTYRGRPYRLGLVMTQKVRFLATQRLSVNARRAIETTGETRPSEEVVAANRAIVAENNMLSEWTYSLDAPPSERRDVLALWEDWFEVSAVRYERSVLDTARMAVFDTRFAHYWANLSPIAFGPLRFKTPNLGNSFRYRRPVLDVIGEHWRYSIYLSLISLLLAYFISIPIGVLAAVKQNQFADRGIGFVLFVLYSMPSFFVGTLLATFLTGAKSIRVLGLELDLAWFPVAGFRSSDPLQVTTLDGGVDVLWHLVLPVFCLTYGALAVLSRYARGGLLDVIRSDYIRTARAKGLSEWVVIVKHAVRNGMIPILTLLGTTLPYLIGGSIVIEYIFAIDGMGRLMLDAISYRDYNVIMGILLISSIFTLFGILLSDISYALVDPRISFE